MSSNIEVIFNFFPILKDDVITRFGYKTHEIRGADDLKLQYLKANIDKDLNDLIFLSIPKSFKIQTTDSPQIVGISLNQYNTLIMNNTVTVLFEEAFAMHDVSLTPLFISTIIKNGKPYLTESIDGVVDFDAPFVKGITEEVPKYYLKEYLKGGDFEFDRLMNDDFFNAIKLLVNNKFFVSATKLIVSMIDTISFLEYGDVIGSFKLWLDKYCDLQKIGVDSSELWEFRNSILHMTNSSSRRVAKKEVKGLMFYVNEVDMVEFKNNGEVKYFNLKTLLHELSVALENWGKEFNMQSDKMGNFINRYDLVISDSRYGKVYFHK